MKKTITLVANNRLHYLKEMVDSLRRNNLTDYSLFIGVEPDESAVVAFCKSMDFMPTQLTINATRLGVKLNPLATISRAFEAGSDLNVHLEDDIILSPDALDLANWYCSLADKDWLCLDLFNYHSDPSSPNVVEESDHFAPLGWVTRRNSWEKHFAPNWMADKRGWDFSVNKLISDGNKKVLMPKLSRSNHIGREGGVHCSQDFHDRVFSRVSISDGSARDYRLNMPE